MELDEGMYCGFDNVGRVWYDVEKVIGLDLGKEVGWMERVVICEIGVGWSLEWVVYVVKGIGSWVLECRVLLGVMEV